MILFLTILLYSSLFILAHTYLFYPIIIIIISYIYSAKSAYELKSYPPLTIIISAFNEEVIIEKTIRNLLKSDYDKDKMEIIIGSDKSQDQTDVILKKLSLEFNNIRFFSFHVRRGKSAVLNDLVNKSSNDILLFTDANTYIHPDAIKKLVKYYEDETIGGVCGRLVLVDDQKNPASGYEEKNYWDMESKLKKLEGNSGILIGANGGIYSIRRNLFENIPTNYPVMDDFFISMKVLEKRKKMVYENDAIAEEGIAPSIKAEFRRKIRNNAIMMSTLKALKSLLKPSYGLVAFAFWSHKVIRWFSPVLLLIILITNIFLLQVSLFFEILFYIQICFYFVSLLGYLFRSKSFYPKFLVMPFYFTMTNIAMLIGLFKFLAGKQTSFWQSTPRK